MRRGRRKEECEYEKQCEWCSDWFFPSRKHARTCSVKCRQALSRQARRKATPKPSPSPSSPAKPSPASPKPSSPKSHPWEAILTKGKADSGLAMEILGVRPPLTKAATEKRFRELTMQHHPDRGGSTQMMQWIIAAWEYLKTFHQWK